PPRVAQLLHRGQEILALDAELLGELVNPHRFSITPSMSRSRLLASSARMEARSARASAPRSTAAAAHSVLRCRYAPRPGTDPSESGLTPSGVAATRRSCRLGAFRRHPTQMRSGSWGTPVAYSAAAASSVGPSVGSASSVAGSPASASPVGAG